jgi:hypothetical protein
MVHKCMQRLLKPCCCWSRTLQLHTQLSWAAVWAEEHGAPASCAPREAETDAATQCQHLPCQLGANMLHSRNSWTPGCASRGRHVPRLTPGWTPPLPAGSAATAPCLCPVVVSFSVAMQIASRIPVEEIGRPSFPPGSEADGGRGRTNEVS